MNDIAALKTPENMMITLAHSIGEFIQYWGFRRIHGQVWTLIYLSKTPLHATEIVARLGVSKALVSLAINELLDYNLIILTSEPERKVKTYVANPELFKVIREVLRARELPMLERIVKDYESLSASHPSEAQNVDNNRLDSLGKMARMASGFTSAFVTGKEGSGMTDSASLNTLIAVLSQDESTGGHQSN